MQRTSIFAQSNKLIFNSHPQTNCPNCVRLQAEIDGLRGRVKGMEGEFQGVKPVLQGLAGFDLGAFEEELIGLRKSYEGLQRMLDALDRENEELVEENSRVLKQNRLLRTDANNHKRQLQKLRATRQAYSLKNSNKQNKNQPDIQIQSQQVLGEITSRKLNTNLNLKKQKDVKEDSKCLEEYLRERERIQGLRHQKIGELDRLLGQF